MSELQMLNREEISLEMGKEIKQKEKESCCCLFFTQIKNFWNWFYSGRIRVSIDLFLLMWEKWTFFYNIGDVLAMIIGGVIKFLVPPSVHEFALQIAIPSMEIFLCLKFIIPALIGIFYLIKFTCIIPNPQAVEKQIKRDDDEYNASLQNIRENGFLSSSGMKFVWQNFKGRLFDFVVTSMFLAFMNLSGTWFVLYCIFVIWGAIGIIKDIIVARYCYCCLINNKFGSEINKCAKVFIEYAKYKPGRYFVNEYQEKNTGERKPETVELENKSKRN